jgi:hypothetical protein
MKIRFSESFYNKYKLFKVIFILLILILIYVFYLTPRFFGLLTFGKNQIDKEIFRLEFDSISVADYDIVYKQCGDRSDLIRLKQMYNLDSLIADNNDELSKILTIMKWVRDQWEHDSDNVAEFDDPIYILEQAQQGKKFRCVEYSFVTSECLLSLGYNVRSVGLMTRDVSNVKEGGGHVINEYYSNDFKKWVFIDTQFDVVTLKDGVPLNSIELQRAIAHNDDFEIINLSRSISRKEYIEFIGPYLYYFSVSLKNEPILWRDRILGTKKDLTLLPIGAKEPKYFQYLFLLNTSYYTNSLKDFYPHPDL